MPHRGAPLLGQPRRHIREKGAESFRHGRMCENGIAQVRIWQTRQDSHLYHGHDLAGFGADHREAKNAVVHRLRGRRGHAQGSSARKSCQIALSQRRTSARRFFYLGANPIHHRPRLYPHAFRHAGGEGGDLQYRTWKKVPDPDAAPTEDISPDRGTELREARLGLRRQLPSNIFVQFLAGPRDIRDGGLG
jgi:hypothetical protein